MAAVLFFWQYSAWANKKDGLAMPVFERIAEETEMRHLRMQQNWS
jgi:hypothetical protein